MHLPALPARSQNAECRVQTAYRTAAEVARRRPAGSPQPAIRNPHASRARLRRLSRHGRKAVLWSLALYAAAQCALLLAMPYWHPTSYQAVADHKWRRVRELTA